MTLYEGNVFTNRFIWRRQYFSGHGGAGRVVLEARQSHLSPGIPKRTQPIAEALAIVQPLAGFLQPGLA
jgi:hypothetical protein